MDDADGQLRSRRGNWQLWPEGDHEPPGPVRHSGTGTTHPKRPRQRRSRPARDATSRRCPAPPGQRRFSARRDSLPGTRTRCRSRSRRAPTLVLRRELSQELVVQKARLLRRASRVSHEPSKVPALVLVVQVQDTGRRRSRPRKFVPVAKATDSSSARSVFPAFAAPITRTPPRCSSPSPTHPVRRRQTC